MLFGDRPETVGWAVTAHAPGFSIGVLAPEREALIGSATPSATAAARR
jgi:hypothetical protein